MNKKVIFVHGEKGGSGKSVVSSVIVDYYINNNETVLLIEGDNSTPDVARRYADDDRVDCVQTSLGAKDPTAAVANIINFVGNGDYDRVVINLPSRAADTIDPLADELIKPAFEMLGYEIVVLFVVAEKIDSPVQANESLKNGLVSIANQYIAVLNQKSDNVTVDNYLWATNPDACRREWLQSGGLEAYLPHLHQRALQLVENGAYSDYLTSNQINIAERILLKRWIDEAHKIGDLIETEAESEKEVEAENEEAA